ncbi:MAG TPA: Lrp/AsnC family transcriptional regulator [Thermoanaerobaculia bacterium]|nr:Lrp/AsnC family transcriptional regulator [Thermoanaerobaculia bacterium]
MAVELDSLDARILSVLLRDGRTPAAQIADEVGLSRPAVADRISRLEKQGVIRGTTVVVEPSAVGRAVTAFIAARGSIGEKSERAFRDLMASDEVVEIHSVAGEDCFFFKVRTDSIPSLNQLVSRLSSPPLSLSTRTTIVMETHCEKVGGIVLGGGSC